jgi:voltage-gated potassium channel
VRNDEQTRTEASRAEAFDRFSRVVDGPLMVLALAMIPLLLVPLIVDLHGAADRAFVAADYFIWAVFAIEYAVKLYLTPARAKFVKGNIPDLVIVVVPMLRPLRLLRSVRLLRLLRLSRVVAFAVEGLSEVKTVLSRRGLNYVLLVVVALVFVAAGLVMEFERAAAGSNIHSYPDALWWAATTASTVGYGDRFPVTAAGRGIAIALMLAGIALFGVLTATIAAHFVEREQSEDASAVVHELRALHARLDRIERHLSM